MTSAANATDFPSARRGVRTSGPAGAAAAPVFDAPWATESTASGGFSLRDGLQLLFKHGRVIAGCAVAVTVLVWAGVALQPKSYEGSGKLWIKTEQQAMPSFLTGIAAYRDQAMPDPPNRKIETEMELLLSRDNAARVVEQLGVRPEQLRRAPLDVVAEHLVPLRAWLSHTVGRPVPPAAADTAVRRQALVEAFLKSFSVEPQRSKGSETSSNVLEIRFAAADPDLVPRAIDAMVQAYIQLAAQQNRRLGEATFSLLEAKAQEARRDLGQSEQELLAFMSANGERVTRATPRTALAGGADAEGTPGGTSVVGSMKAQAVDLQRRLDDLRQMYTEEAQNVRTLGQSIASLQSRIKREVRANAEADAQLAMLERQRALAQERFIELQRRLDQIDVYLKVNPTEAESRVMTESPERPLRPETKRLGLVIALGPIGGLLLGLALAGLREMLDRRLQTPDELRRGLGLPVLAALPALPQRVLPAQQYAARLAGAQRRLGRVAGGDGRTSTVPGELGPDTGVTLLPGQTFQAGVAVVNGRVASDRSLLMHRLALRVREQLPVQGLGRVLVVTSARPGEGKSVIARALAKRLAQQSRGSVLLVDASPDSPAGHGGERVRGRPGFFDILRDSEVMAELAGSRDNPRLQTLGTGFDPEAGLLYHDAAVEELLDKVRERYDWTVLDASTLQYLGSLAAHADAVLLVVDAQTTRREVVQGALDAAHLPEGRVLGTVLNRRPQYVPAWLYRHVL